MTILLWLFCSFPNSREDKDEIQLFKIQHIYLYFFQQLKLDAMVVSVQVRIDLVHGQFLAEMLLYWWNITYFYITYKIYWTKQRRLGLKVRKWSCWTSWKKLLQQKLRKFKNENLQINWQNILRYKILNLDYMVNYS